VEIVKFKVSGKFKASTYYQPFTKIIEAKDEESAKHYIYSILGSKHRVRRHLIKMKVEVLKDE
jgi:large subunit ribosomal protein LX